MLVFPAIDLYGTKAVRLEKGDYSRMTVYSDNPVELSVEFAASGARYMHAVDLEGARDGNTPNIETIEKIAGGGMIKLQVGGGIRNEAVVEKYLAVGVERVIIGTAAVTDPDFLCKMTGKYGSRIAAGADIRDGRAAIRGWKEDSELTCDELFDRLTDAGVETVICTDISKDGMLSGTNIEMYGRLMQKYKVNLIASGGVSTLDDVRALRDMGIYGAIIGKAIYTGSVDLPAAVMCAHGKL